MRPFLLFAIAGALVAANRPVSGPVLGYVLDTSVHKVRPLLGIAGASVAGMPLNTRADLYQAVYSPVHHFILALAGENLTPLLIIPEQQTAAPIDGALPGAKQIVLSPQGSTAILYFDKTATAQILTRLPETPAVARSVDLSVLPAAPSALAVSDDGSALVAVIGGDAPVLDVFTTDGMSTVPLAEPATAFAFLNDSHDAVITGASGALLLRDVLNGAAPNRLSADGIDSPIAVAVTSDNTHAIALNSDSHGVVVLDLEGGPPAVSNCGCSGSGITRLAGNAFRLTDYTGGPLTLFDASPGNARLLFVPPARSLEN